MDKTKLDFEPGLSLIMYMKIIRILIDCSWDQPTCVHVCEAQNSWGLTINI